MDPPTLSAPKRALCHVLRLVLAPCATAMLIGCDAGETGLRYGSAELDHGAVPQLDASSRILCDTAALGIPTDLLVVGDYLVVLDIASDSVLHFFDRRTKTYRGQLGRRGEGPGEVMAAWSLDHYGEADNAFWLYDAGLRRLTEVDIRRSLAAGQLSHTQLIGLIASGTPTGPLWLDSTIVSLGFFTQGRIMVFNREGEPDSTIGPVPKAGDELPPSVVQHVYQGTLVRRPDGQKLAAVTRHAGQIEIYDMHGARTLRNGPLTVEPRYSVRSGSRGPSMRTGSDLRFGYVDATATQEHIYALFSGRTREGFPGRAYLGSHVHVFDWNGNFEYALSLDSEVGAITIEVNASVLYALRHNPTPAVLAYDLSTIPSRGLMTFVN